IHFLTFPFLPPPRLATTTTSHTGRS
ncbi:hypothetical protein EE612_018422, partial [Oryza sativa]